MNISEAITESFGSIRAHKLRSFLTLLGQIIGVMTLILVMAIERSNSSPWLTTNVLGFCGDAHPTDDMTLMSIRRTEMRIPPATGSSEPTAASLDQIYAGHSGVIL